MNWTGTRAQAIRPGAGDGNPEAGPSHPRMVAGSGHMPPSRPRPDPASRLVTGQMPQAWTAANLAATPPVDRPQRRNRPQRGRQRLVAERSSSPSIIWVNFSERTHMMALAQSGKHRFSEETGDFDVPRSGNSKGFFTKRSQMKGGSCQGMIRFGVGLVRERRERQSVSNPLARSKSVKASQSQSK